jgi:hypothetical protein
MRRLTLPTCILALLSMVVTGGCGRSSAGPEDAGPSLPAVEAPSLGPTVPATAVPPVATVPGSVPAPVAPALASPASSPAPVGAAVLGTPCSPGKDSIACTADGVAVVTCAGGVWRTLELCRGAGKCKGVGSALSCDTGLPQPGDACVAATAESQCRSARETMSCRGGRWMVSPCDPGKLCFRANGKGQAGCK